MSPPDAEPGRPAARVPGASPPAWRWVAALVFVLGVGLQGWFWVRGAMPVGHLQTPAGAVPCAVSKYDDHSFLADQLAILAPAIALAERGELLPYAKRVSGGGILPGALLQLLTGPPLAVAYDYLAASSVLLAVHLLAGLLLWRVTAQAGGHRFAALFLAIAWLSPWRLYHSGFLWEPSYLLLPAAAHLWASWRQRSAGRRLPSLALGATLTLTVQLHLSAVVLVVLTGLQLWRRQVVVRWRWLVAGGALGAATLVPTVAAWTRGALAGAGPSEGFIGFGLVKLYPLLRGANYWLRLSSFDTGRRIRQTAFLEGGGELGVVGWVVLALSVLGWGSVVVAAVANYSVFARARREPGRSEPGRAFLVRYAATAGVALLVAIAVSPVTPQSYHVQIVLVAACLPVALWVERRLDDGARWLRWSVVAFVVLRLPVAIALGAGHPMYAEPPPGPCRSFDSWAEQLAAEGHPSSEVVFSR